MDLHSLSGLRSAALVLIAALSAGCGGGDDAGSSPSSAPVVDPGGSAGAPTIQGAPARSVLVGRRYSFRPTASDPNGDTLTFSATNLPPWAALNTADGSISGTPTSADIGTFRNIVVSVSDGRSTASLSPFSIDVTAVGSGAVTLSWTPPTQNSDGSALGNLAGYQVLFGQNAEVLDQKVDLTNPSLSSFVVDDLTSGTWYFAVSAVNSSGIASPLSNITSKTIG